MNCFHFSWMRKQKMRTQIIILYIGLLILTLTLIQLVFYVQELIYKQISIDTIKVLGKQDVNSIIGGAARLSNYVQNRQLQVIRQIQSVKNFFDFYQQNQNEIPPQFQQEPCLQRTQAQNMPIFLGIPRFCYQANGILDSISIPKDDKDLQNIQSVGSLLNAFALVEDPTVYALQIASLSDTQYFSQYPYCVISKDYDIRKRPWYPYHLEQSQLHPNQSFFISSLYQYFNKSQLEMAATQSIKLNNSLLGIVKLSLKIKPDLIPKVPYNIMLIDSNDNVVLQNNQSQINSSIFQVYDVDKTGLNRSDWDRIEQFSFSHKKNEFIQLIDKRYNTIINAHAELFYQDSFTFVVTSNVTNVIELQNQLDLMNRSMMDEFLRILLSQVSVFLFIMIIEIFLITRIFKPMTQLQSLIGHHINSMGNNIDINVFKIAFIKQHFNFETNSYNHIFHLSDIYNKSQNRKSEICKQQEQIELNRKERNLNTQFIRKGLQYVGNYRKKITKKALLSLIRFIFGKNGKKQ